MSSFCREFGAQKRAEIDFKSDGLPRHVPRTFLFVSSAYYRRPCTMQCNIAGTTVRCAIVATSDEIHLTVSDCGAGFDLETARKARGLVSTACRSG